MEPRKKNAPFRRPTRGRHQPAIEVCRKTFAKSRTEAAIGGMLATQEQRRQAKTGREQGRLP
jgi:hypothetical protein